ncbi:MAG: hypothetical protein IJI37_00020, partial [Opitutales bacterium]|nr:hypothetical protein [Opitutales bacterium]
IYQRKDESVTNAVVNATTVSEIAIDLTVSEGYARNTTIGEGITLNAQQLCVRTSSDTSGAFTINGAVNLTTGMFYTKSGSDFKTSNVVVNGAFSIATDISDNGKLNLLVDNGGAVNVGRNVVLRDGAVVNVANGSFAAVGNFATNEGNVSVTVGADATMSSKAFTLGNGGTLNLGGALTSTSFTLAKGGTLNLGGTLTATGGLIFRGESTANISGTLNVSGGELLMDKDSTSNKGPTVTVSSGANINITSGYFRTRTATLDLVSGSTMTINNPYGNASITAAGTLYVRNGAELYITTTNSATPVINAYQYISISGKLVVNGGKWIAASGPGITFNTSDVELNGVNLALGNNYGSGGDFLGGKIWLNAGFTLDATDSALLVAKQGSGQSLFYLKENATAKLAGIGFWFNEEATKLNLTLESGAKLLLTDLINDGGLGDYFGTLGDGDKIIVTGFAENSIGIKNHTAADDALLSKIEAAGVEQFYWVNDAVAGYWWLSTEIPEPADWASIFALAALAAAIYRRRK